MSTAAESSLSASAVNSFRIAAVASRLNSHVRSPTKNDTVEFFHLCLSLARGIDYSVANSELPLSVQDLPLLLKRVCRRRNESLLQAAIMVLMISVKNACKKGWFPAKESEELLTLADEIGSSFCSVRDMSIEVSNYLQTISRIMLRFYPRMKMGQTLAFLEIKPGYGAFVIDFHISKNAKPSAEDKVWLFVAQTDNVETSSCIISPPQVNFLLNGKGVEGRTNVHAATGPQLPTAVTRICKYGTNLLQVVGQFSGNYIVTVAYMSVISTSDHPVLLDYVQPAVAAMDSDSEIIEGASRISLNCPISFRRIKTPVKGHSCKHLQCFDFDNFVNINTRNPSWRCPHCNQCVSYIDIRVDQNMVKVLKEVGDNVDDVIISADGSWKAVVEGNDNADRQHDETSNCKQDGLAEQKNASSISNAPLDIMDLTEGDDEMDAMLTCETQDRKPILANLESQLANLESQSSVRDVSDASVVNQNAAPIEEDFWSGIFLPPYGSGASGAGSDTRIVGGISGSASTNLIPSPVLTDAVSPALNREPEAFQGSALIATPLPQNQISAPSNLQLQQSEFGNSIVSNEYGRVPSMPRNINRTPIAVQALPAQIPTTVPQQRSRNSFNTMIPQGPSLTPQTSAAATIANGFNSIERQQQFSRSHLNPLQVSHLTSSSLQQQSTPNWDQAAQQILGLPTPSQLPGAYRVSPIVPIEHQNSRQQQTLQQSLNLMATTGMSQSPILIRSPAQMSSHFPRNQIPQGSTQSGVGQTAFTEINPRLMAAQRAVLPPRQSPLMTTPIQTTRVSPTLPANIDGFRASVGDQRGTTGGSLQPIARTDGLAELPTEQNWRPTGRMRGSLSGRAYSAALNQLIIQPTQPVQPARPPLNRISPPPGIPEPLHVLMANSRNALASQAVNNPPTEPTSMAASSGVLPERSSGLP